MMKVSALHEHVNDDLMMSMLVTVPFAVGLFYPVVILIIVLWFFGVDSLEFCTRLDD